MLLQFSSAGQIAIVTGTLHNRHLSGAFKTNTFGILDVIRANVFRQRRSHWLEKARVSLLLGWAKRQINQLIAAEKLLLEATTLDPKSSRGFFELGKVYQAGGQFEKAMVLYRKALAQFFWEVEETEIFDRQQEQKLNTYNKSADPQ